MRLYSRSELESLIDNYVLGFHAERNRRIIKDKLIWGVSLKDIASKYHLSETRVKTVIRTFKRNMEALDK